MGHNKRRSAGLKCILIFTGGFFSLVSPLSFAEEPSSDQGVKHNGVVFNIAKDRKIEKIGGIYEPEGVDKYVNRKINEVNDRIERLEVQVIDSNKKLDAILKQLADDAAKNKTSGVI